MPSPSSSPSPSPTSMRRRPKGWARRCERCCCVAVTYLPLVFVYGLTTWAVWVESSIGFLPQKTAGYGTSFLGVLLYFLLNWSYTTAVITSPGSTVSNNNIGYSHLPTYEIAAHDQHDLPSFTVKSTGATRFCKKCQARKPDRAHHCSTCKRCVLKMDHHCPWLATCVGLRNYKPFLLFLIYTTIFCWVCFGVTGTWLWKEVINNIEYEETLMPVNYVLLCVISGIIGLVLTGFTGWHLSLAVRNQTTIECLEKTRYLSPLRREMRRQQQQGGVQGYGQQLAEIHANAIPGATRDEDGEESLTFSNSETLAPSNDHISSSLSSSSSSPTRQSSYRNHTYINSDSNYHQELERQRDRQRYEDYLDEKDSESLPNAFDLGWKENLRMLFGQKPILWGLPICNSVGDGWHWSPSARWVEAREEIRRKREGEWMEGLQERGRWDESADHDHHHLVNANNPYSDPYSNRQRQDHTFKSIDDDRTSSQLSLKTLRRKESFDDRRSSYDDEEEEEEEEEEEDDNDNDDDNGAKKERNEYKQFASRKESRNALLEFQSPDREESHGWQKWD